MTAGAQSGLRSLQQSALARVLFVGHAGGGGVGRHMEDLARALRGSVEVLALQPHGRGHVKLRWLRGVDEPELWPDASNDWPGLLELLGAIGIDRVHFHHVDGLPQDVLDLPSQLGCPHDVTLHDYFPACPSYHLADASGRFCGMEPDCGKCADRVPAQWPMTIAEWRARFGGLLSSASRVIAPSADTAGRIRAFFPQVCAFVWPHPEIPAAAPPIPLRVLVPGAISILKGLDVLRDCVGDAARRGLALHFVVLGYLGLPLPQWPEAPLTVTGEFPEGTLPALIAKEHGDAFFFPSQCPETYSYTLSAALQTGLPIVATDLGAIGERLRAHPGARILPWDTPASEMNDALLSVGAQRRAAATPPTPVTAYETYRDTYLAGFEAPRRHAPAPAVEIPERWLREPPAAAERLPLAYYFEDGVVCGKARSLEELRRYAFDPDAVYADMDSRFSGLLETLWAERAQAASSLAQFQAEAERAAAKADIARARLREVEESTSWRMTAPLRRLVGLLRRKA